MHNLRKQLAHRARPVGLSLLVTLITLGTVTQAAGVARRVESPGPPFYARIQAGFVPTNGEWAAVAFYRDPACVPEDFNLLAMFNTAALACPRYVTCTEIWNDRKVGPLYVQLLGLEPVPIWFVSWAELEAAMVDGVLTVGELADLPSVLVGYATFYNEEQHPYPAIQQCHSSAVASGCLEDGRRFQYEMVEWNNALHHIRIEFK